MRQEAIARRRYWVAELAKLSGSFEDDSTRMTAEIRAEIAKDGMEALLDHLRLCGAMPEQYGHDSSEEKLYSKYTDAVVCETFIAIGLQATLLTARADAADIQARGGGYSLVADAKAFRLSRTAKNQKDFKIQAMDGWRGGLDHAVVIGPIYQFPGRTSQIYQQAVARNVCILGYCHLAALVGLVMRGRRSDAMKGFGTMLRSVSLMHLTKSATDYWSAINRALAVCLKRNGDLWTTEKAQSLDALTVVKQEALAHLRAERDRLLGLTHRQALDELLRVSGIDSRIAQVMRIELGQLLGDSD